MNSSLWAGMNPIWDSYLPIFSSWVDDIVSDSMTAAIHWLNVHVLGEMLTVQ
ncbi:hypothetical protein [Lysinibacillus contaminans]|uniref:hypothetical protein n=1 Tax=Lysinibacillus contaminans TaxID=1293441 RepID=UPI000A743583|nr:hypothetical protein [Lysinibacillus contaminans]